MEMSTRKGKIKFIYFSNYVIRELERALVKKKITPSPTYKSDPQPACINTQYFISNNCI